MIVTDKTGTHLHNLAKADFVILEDGKEQQIASFEEIQNSDNPLQHLATQQNQFSNQFALGSAKSQFIILVFDSVNTALADQASAKLALLKYLANSVDRGPATSLLAITRGGIKVIHDFTTDPKVLVAALQKMPMEQKFVEEASQEKIPQGDPVMAQALARQREQERLVEAAQRHAVAVLTFQAMRQIAQFCAGLTGRKALLWATAGFPFSPGEGDLSDLANQAWAALNQAQVAVYPIGVQGLVDPASPDINTFSPEAGFYSRNVSKGIAIQDTFQQFAEATGGRAFYNRNDLKDAFQAAADDNHDYYLLSYYFDRQGKKPGWHKLNVTVHRDRVQVRARRGFFLTTGDSSQVAKSEVQIALSSPLDYTAIPITGQWQSVTPVEQGKMRVIFQLTMPPDFAQIDKSDSNHFLVQFVAVARTETGVAADETSKTMDGHLKPGSVDKILKSGMDYRGFLTLPPGEYTVHFAVQDHLSGRIGSVTAPLKVSP